MAPESPEKDSRLSGDKFNLIHPDAETEALDPVLQQQVDDNLQLLYRSKLEATLPDNLQALVQKLLDEGRST